tara:strand:+ start:6964 stop:7893 length:930 start_codon:yes stop_codon:yes gene_type:complete
MNNLTILQNVTPKYDSIRTFLGKKDLVVSFYSRRCQFQCTHCDLPLSSPEEDISAEDVNAQVDWLLEKYAGDLPSIQVLSFGNDGSILDAKRFPRESLEYIFQKFASYDNITTFALETRPEYLTSRSLSFVKDRFAGTTIDATIGFETVDDHLREDVLVKQIPRKSFERSITLLGEFGAQLTCYVMLKPGPHMTEEEGVQEAQDTIQYLHDLTKKEGIHLNIYLNPTYIPETSTLAGEMEEVGYKPPKIQSVAEVIRFTHALNIHIYTGLWSEGLARDSMDYTRHDDYDPQLREQIRRFNQTNDISLLS